MKIDVQITQTKFGEDYRINVPDDVEDVKEWLTKKGYIDNILDYAETRTEINILHDD